jgi:hypothetical protein
MTQAQTPTKTERQLEDAIRVHAGDVERVTALERARRFKRSWVELAEALVQVRERESFRRWGYSHFDDYTAKELRLRPQTVDKLCASYGFLRANAPRLLREPPPEEEEGVPFPSWQAVDFLARAEERGAAPEETMEEMRHAVFEEGTAAPALSRRYREVAFPLADDEKRERNKNQLLSTARRLAELCAETDLAIPRKLAERVEEVVGEIVAACAT